MTVSENILFAVSQKLSLQEKEEFVLSTLQEAQLSQELAQRYPSTLSGGQQARVALMRTLASQPHVLLLDEAFSRLDAKIRGIIREFVFRIVAKNGIPTVLVTHDKQDIADDNHVVEFT